MPRQNLQRFVLRVFGIVENNKIEILPLSLPMAISAGRWQVIPNVLIRAQAHLGLDAVDVVVLLNMNMHWWQKGDFPFPRPTTIAKRMGISKRTVERRIGKLVKAGLLERLPLTKEGNLRRYKLDGLELPGLVPLTVEIRRSWTLIPVSASHAQTQPKNHSESPAQILFSPLPPHQHPNFHPIIPHPRVLNPS